MKKKSNGRIVWIALTALVLAFMLVSHLAGFAAGKDMTVSFFRQFIDILKILPFVFLLLGQFEAWVSRSVVEKHFGESSGFMAYVWMILLGGTTLGPMVVALPLAKSLHDKGAKPSVVFTYLGAAAVCRIPMTVFEASYVGIKFTVIRYLVSLPLIIITALVLEKIAGKFPGNIPADGNK